MFHKALYTSKYIYIINTTTYFKCLAVIPFYISKAHGGSQACVAGHQPIIQVWIGSPCYSTFRLWGNGYSKGVV